MGLVSSCLPREISGINHRAVNHTQANNSPSPCIDSSSSIKSGDINSKFVSPLKKITIIHFNDVYNIEARDKEPVGGAARFKTKIDSLSDRHPLVLFSGDAIAPSIMSVVTLGKQMVPVLNSLNVQVAVYGNHEFDFGVEHLIQIKNETNFPWLMSNVIDKETEQYLANGERYSIIYWDEVKIGLMGLVEKEWLATLATVNLEDVKYIDYVEVAKELEEYFRQQGCDIVIALTHMRWHNDERLADNVPGLDLILGGHDHHYKSKTVNGVPILKSGSDFRDFSEIIVTLCGTEKPKCSFIRHEITADIAEDEEVKEVVDYYSNFMKHNLEEQIGLIGCSLEGRFECIRTQETNLGDLVCDIMRDATKADCALINSGTFRSDTVHDAGVFKMKDLVAILPMVDPLTVLSITGRQLLDTLENGVSQYPRLEGRFPQVSGLTFMFDPKKPSGHRIQENSVTIQGETIDFDKEYSLCTKAYLAEGKDGYEVLKTLPVILSHEEGPILSNIVQNHFRVFCSNGTSNGDSVDSAVFVGSPSDDVDGSVGGSISPQVEGRIIICG